MFRSCAPRGLKSSCSARSRGSPICSIVMQQSCISDFEITSVDIGMASLAMQSSLLSGLTACHSHAALAFVFRPGVKYAISGES